MASPDGSDTGSFDHGVSWLSWLLSDQVKPEPDSDTRKPNDGFAITLIHGRGVRRPSPRTVTYSRPFFAKPPSPLKNSRSGTGSGTSRRLPGRSDRGAEGVAASVRCDRVTCSNNVPRLLSSTTRATVCSSVCSCAETSSARKSTILPLTPLVSGERRSWLPCTSASRELCRSCAYDGGFSFIMTRSADNCFVRQYSCARSNCRTISTSSALSMRASTIGRSPEMPWAHSAERSSVLRLSTSEDGRSDASEYRTALASLWNT